MYNLHVLVLAVILSGILYTAGYGRNPGVGIRKQSKQNIKPTLANVAELKRHQIKLQVNDKMTAPPAYPPTYYPGAQPQQYPTAPKAKELEYLHVKTRYRDQDMLSTFKMHIFSDEGVLSQVAAEVFSIYGQSEIKRNNAQHCISVNKLGKSTHYAEGQLFRMLSRYGFTFRTSNSSIIPMAEHINDVLTMYVFAR